MFICFILFIQKGFTATRHLVFPLCSLDEIVKLIRELVELLTILPRFSLHLNQDDRSVADGNI